MLALNALFFCFFSCIDFLCESPDLLLKQLDDQTDHKDILQNYGLTNHVIKSLALFDL